MCLLCSWTPCVQEDRILSTDFREIFFPLSSSELEEVVGGTEWLDPRLEKILFTVIISR